MSQPRRISTTGFYHVILVGNNHQRIFEDREDCRKFLYVLSDSRQTYGFTVLAYCLMSNHVHLLIRPGKIELSNVFMSFGARYVRWYNEKYARTGHLFQERYKSKPVDDLPYLLTVVRYIHLNPVKAGICRTPQQYEFSSYSSYFKDPLIDSAFMMTLMSRDKFTEFHSVPNDDECMDIDGPAVKALSDKQAIAEMTRVSGCKNASEFQKLDPDRRNKALHKMLASGVRLRQASRITGISYQVVRKCR